jgi:Predicted transcriptional regulator
MSVLTRELPRGATVIEKNGKPEYVVVPYDEFLRLFRKSENLIPNEVVSRYVDCDSIVRAWREYLGLTQAEVADRMSISQSAYSQLEASPRLRPSSRRKIALALGVSYEQLA